MPPRQYCVKTERVPLVVSMPGLMKGAGLPALVEILRYANPATVLHLSSDAAKSDVDLDQELHSIDRGCCSIDIRSDRHSEQSMFGIVDDDEDDDGDSDDEHV